MEYIFIVNPKARSGRGGKIWKQLKPMLMKRNLEYKIYFTKGRHDAEKIAAKVTADGEERTIVVLGGDGTVNGVVNGITFLDRVILGYIPIGSSNDFARGAGMGKDVRNALEAILSPREVMAIDIGVLRYKERERRFVVSAGIGFDAAVCHQVCVSPWKIILNKLNLGKLSYAAVAIDRLRKDKPVLMKVCLTDREGNRIKKVYKAYFAAFMNLPYEGGGFQFCPDARFDDRMLDVILISDISKLKILCLLPTAFFGKHVGFRGVNLYQCQDIKIRTKTPMYIHTDGEPIVSQREIRVGLEKKRLRVVIR